MHFMRNFEFSTEGLWRINQEVGLTNSLRENSGLLVLNNDSLLWFDYRCTRQDFRNQIRKFGHLNVKFCSISAFTEQLDDIC